MSSLDRHEYRKRDEWLSLRENMGVDRLGGSEIGVAAGNSEYDSAYSLFCKRIGLIPKKDISLNEPIIQGHDFEENVANRFGRISGKKLYEDKCIFTNGAFPHLMATPDRLICDEDSGLECKTAQRDAWAKNEKGDFPITYFNQCCLYMAVTQRKRWYLSALVYGTAFKSFLITRVKAEAERYAELKAKFDGLFTDEEKRRYVLPMDERVAYFADLKHGLAPTDIPETDVASWNSEYDEWVKSWCYLEAVYCVDDEELAACETVAEQFLGRVKAVKDYMASQTVSNEENRKVLLASAASQIWPQDEIDASEATSDAIAEIYPEATAGKSIALDGVCVTSADGTDGAKTYRELLDEREDVMAEIKRLEARKSEIDNMVVLKMGDAEKATLEGFSISHKNATYRSLDKELIKKDLGEETMSKYYKETNGRRLYIRKNKAK